MLCPRGVLWPTCSGGGTAWQVPAGKSRRGGRPGFHQGCLAGQEEPFALPFSLSWLGPSAPRVPDQGTVGVRPLPRQRRGDGMHSLRVLLRALPGKGHVLGPDAVRGTQSLDGDRKGERVVCSWQQMARNRGEATLSWPQLLALWLVHAGRGKGRRRGTWCLHILRWGETELGQKASEEAASPVLPPDTWDMVFSPSDDRDNQ